MRFLISIVAALLLTGSATAAEKKLSGPEISQILTEQQFQGTHRGGPVQQFFSKSGSTLYTENGSPSQGLWEVRGDQYCSQWPPSETWSCYDVLADGNAMSFVSPDGTRFDMTRAP